MTSSKRNPGAGGAGARKNDLIGTTISSENIPPHRLLQVQRLVGRLGLSQIRAELIARLAWEEARP
jgi:hypothetical protein